MAWTIDDALSNKHVVDAKIFIGEVCFRLGNLAPKVTIKLYRRPGDREVYFQESHFIRIPELESADVVGPKSDNDEAYALTHAVEGLTRIYNAAVEQGLQPSDSWLVANDAF
jgi:hypothetical protein